MFNNSSNKSHKSNKMNSLINTSEKNFQRNKYVDNTELNQQAKDMKLHIPKITFRIPIPGLDEKDRPQKELCMLVDPQLQDVKQ